MIEMRYEKFPAVRSGQFLQDRQQHHRIRTAGNRDENPFTRAKQLSRADGVSNRFQQRLHIAMLPTPAKPEQGIYELTPALPNW